MDINSADGPNGEVDYHVRITAEDAAAYPNALLALQEQRRKATDDRRSGKPVRPEAIDNERKGGDRRKAADAV